MLQLKVVGFVFAIINSIIKKIVRDVFVTLKNEPSKFTLALPAK